VTSAGSSASDGCLLDGVAGQQITPQVDLGTYWRWATLVGDPRWLGVDLRRKVVVNTLSTMARSGRSRSPSRAAGPCTAARPPRSDGRIERRLHDVRARGDGPMQTPRRAMAVANPRRAGWAGWSRAVGRSRRGYTSRPDADQPGRELEGERRTATDARKMAMETGIILMAGRAVESPAPSAGRAGW